MVIPARVVGLGDGVHFAVQRARLLGRMVAPHVDRHQARRVVLRAASWPSCARRRPRGCRGRCPRPRRRGSRRRSTGAARRRARPSAPGCSAPASSAGVCEYHLPAPSTGPTPCHTRIPAASRRSSSAGVQRVLGARGVRADRLQLANDLALVVGRQRVAAPERVLLDGRAVQLQARAVEVHQPAVPASAARSPTRAE